MKLPASRCSTFSSLPWLSKVNALALCAAALAFSFLLWPEWRHDDDLTHGIFLPFLAGILAFESRRDPNPRFLRPGIAPTAVGVLLVLLSLGALAVAILDASAMGWNHAMAEFLLAASLVFALGAAWLGLADQRLRFIPFNWPAFIAIILWMFATPPPPGTYSKLSALLQGRVTEGVVRAFEAFGIAAYRSGNVIELARTSVGVSEACSGVRSLISCTVAGLFLSALLVRRHRSRMLVIFLTPVIGLSMNFLRSLLLTLLANAGVGIEGRWHDFTGASILIVTTILVAAFAIWLHRGEVVRPPETVEAPTASTGRSPLLQWILAAALLLVAFSGGVLLMRVEPLLERPGRMPNLEALLPAPSPGWSAKTTAGLDRYKEVLGTNALVERVYSTGSMPQSAHLTLYVAYWRPGQAPVSLVELHTPDACWPGTGWESKPVADERAELGIEGRMLAPAEFRLFEHDRYETHVWFWHLYGRHPLAFVDPYSTTRVLGLAWRFGFNRPRDQLFVLVSSNRPWKEIASQPTLQEFFRRLKPLGL
jgi:exosortase